MKKIIGIILFVLIFPLGMGKMQVYGMENARITWSPDGNAFTTNSGEQNTKWYEVGQEVYTGEKKTLRELNIGEHLYDVSRTDNVPVSKWSVSLKRGVCCHNSYKDTTVFHGVDFEKHNCFGAYYSGWFAYCADCERQIVRNYIYMSADVAKSLTCLDLSKSYYYLCPHCRNLEQGIVLGGHICKAISDNRYFVRYHANYGQGYMGKSTHMVNNSTLYEGKEVTPQTALNLNTFTRVGYEFVGWNTRKDGSGTAYKDGATIYNLSMEENADIILYAQWEKRTSVLRIDANGGTYDGKQEIIEIPGKYGETYEVSEGKLIPPWGYTVSFDTRGGSTLQERKGRMKFSEWMCEQPFGGKLVNGIYYFEGENGETDCIRAIYVPEPVYLPLAVREGYAFGGWYADAECTIPVGRDGSEFVPAKDTLLYAGWVDLQLVSNDNYISNGGKGAVNLSWNQKDSQSKTYEIYQKKEGNDWIRIQTLDERIELAKVEKSIGFTGESGSFRIPHTGFYDICLSGAQGVDYGVYKGGRGGRIQATVYLKKGEILNYTLGGQNGYSGGGKGFVYGNGGGYSILSTERLGTILQAGGGGGASLYCDGEAGGTSKQVITMSGNGQSGEIGGGGGFQGGVSGEVKVHHHTQECNHVHVGTPKLCGGCYTLPDVCGGKDIKFIKSHSVFYYGNIADDGSHQYCVRCASHECNGHLNEYGTFICNACGYSQPTYFTECNAISAYGLSCERNEDYICGRVEGEIIYAKPAYGGSNYINTVACIQYKEQAGVQEGNGELILISKQIGMVDDKELNGVPATDDMPPHAIERESINITAIRENEVKISFNNPGDRGTRYYHQVKSFDINTMNLICVSNITTNELITNVVGYYYTIDENPDTGLTEESMFLKEQGEEPFIMVNVDKDRKYLHIAPVDRAGNMGKTVHIYISREDIVYWPLQTEQVLVKDGENIFAAENENTYYVRADGDTPLELTMEGFLCGTARKTYQINEGFFKVSNMASTEERGNISIVVPNREKVQAGTYTYPTTMLQKKISGQMFLEDASFVMAKRYNDCKNLLISQRFTVAPEYDGYMLQISPCVMAKGEKENVFSKEEKDLENSIYLLPDGKGPVIEGGEKIWNLGRLDWEETEELTIELLAYDTGSGLRNFYAEVQNLDNGMSQTFYDTDEPGKIELHIEATDRLFQGKFYVLVYAADRVGNSTSFQNEMLGVGLEARVEKILEPGSLTFKRGESGILCITTWGYIEKLEILFPEAFVKEDPTLERVIIYEIPNYLQEEKIPFMVPLNVPDQMITIRVKAYKADTELEKEPKMMVIEIKGSVLDELRTRLR